MTLCRTALPLFFLILCLLALATSAFGQTEAATLSGLITDPQGKVVPGVAVEVTNVETNVSAHQTTNNAGLYVVVGLKPGRYRVSVAMEGFRRIDLTDLVLNVQDVLSRNFQLQLGPVSTSITVVADTTKVNTEDASVGTVIDRNFAENLPLNGRSFNTLLQLTPGVAIVPNINNSPGQFSIAGQRTDANSFTIDGVSANFGMSTGGGGLLGASGTGSAQAFSVLGSTSSLVSVDALQEFRIETSSFSPEFGKSPGGQVILTTRSGTNDFHGAAFDYFRNTIMDANNWFSDAAIPQIPKAPEHHNDFGAVLGGPIWKNKTFFFASYEGARLDLPSTQKTQVPYIASTVPACSPSAAIAPFLEAYPKPNGPVSSATCTGQFTGAFANKATLDAGSLRIDHTFNERFSIFGRYNRAPSQSTQRGNPLSDVQTTGVGTQTVTVGLNMVVSAQVSNFLRGNYSTQSVTNSAALDSFGGASPVDPALLLGSLPSATSLAGFGTNDTGFYLIGTLLDARTKQLNVTDDLVAIRGTHQLKFGGDYRAIFLDQIPDQHEPAFSASSVQSFLSSGQADLFANTSATAHLLTQSLSLYGQDIWRVTPRLTLTYGLRWELSPAPSGRNRTMLASWQNVNNPAALALAPAGTSIWKTRYVNLAPRVGIAYSLTDDGKFVFRAGGGIFYDLGVGSAADLAGAFPNFASLFTPGLSLPVANVTPFLPSIAAQPPFSGFLEGFDPNLRLPRSYQWNVALEKSFGAKQVVSATYVGQAGRGLLRKEVLLQPNSNFASDFQLAMNNANSDYHALQLQYRSSLSRTLQMLLNYTWSHSLDNSSDDTANAVSHTVISAQSDRGSSDFDVRHSFSGGLSYTVPTAAVWKPLSLVMKDWSIDTVVVARTGLPFNGKILFNSPGGFLASSRPDLAPGRPFWTSDSTAPGGKILNPAAFSIPSTARQGTERRNDIPGFGLTQIDLSIGRKFPIKEPLNLELRGDAFNIFNHPNFWNPPGLIELFPFFGQSSVSMLNSQLGAGGGLNALFNEGGPRSLQVSLKLSF